MFISNAWAQDVAAQASPASGALIGYLPIFVVIAIFYFLVLRPQAKKAREHDEMVKNLKKGDTIVTNAGLHGKITSISKEDGTLMLKISKDVEVKMSLYAVGHLDGKDASYSGADRRGKKSERAAR